MNKSNQYQKTREAILNAANRILTADGAEGFTLEAVARETPVSKGGLLYHFPSKNSLIEGMIKQSIAQVEEALKEELSNANGDYLTAYIKASFRTTVAPDQVSRAILCAVAGNPKLLAPLREHFERMQAEISAAAPSAELGTMIRLCMDGLWYSQVYQFAPPDEALGSLLKDMLITLVHTGRFP